MATNESTIIDDDIGGGFRYRDFIECSATWKSTQIENTPVLQETFDAIQQLCLEVLVPVQEAFAQPELTFGFCSYALSRKIRSGIAPTRDQHAGYELNHRDERICPRGGFASDFLVQNFDSLEIARWIVSETPFDRLYFYGSERPLHVSVNAEPLARQIVSMTTVTEKGHRIPRVMSRDRFLGVGQ